MKGADRRKMADCLRLAGFTLFVVLVSEIGETYQGYQGDKSTCNDKVHIIPPLFSFLPETSP